MITLLKIGKSKMLNKKYSFILMHLGFVIYSFYSVVGKLASLDNQSKKTFLIFYLLLIVILGLYAIIWQQVLKVFHLSTAYTNKAVIIIWGMLWGKLIFKEQFTLKKIIAVLLIFTGIIILNYSKTKEAPNE